MRERWNLPRRSGGSTRALACAAGLAFGAFLAFPAALYVGFFLRAPRGAETLAELGLGCVLGAFASFGLYPLAYAVEHARWSRRLRRLDGRCLLCGRAKHTSTATPCAGCGEGVGEASAYAWTLDTPAWPGVPALCALACGTAALVWSGVLSRSAGPFVGALVLGLLSLAALTSVFSGTRGARRLGGSREAHLAGPSDGARGWLTLTAAVKGAALEVSAGCNSACERDGPPGVELRDARLQTLAAMLGAAIDRDELRVHERRALRWSHDPRRVRAGAGAEASYRDDAGHPGGDACAEERAVGAYRDELLAALALPISAERERACFGEREGDPFVELRRVAECVSREGELRDAVERAAPAVAPRAMRDSAGTRAVVAQLRALGFT